MTIYKETGWDVEADPDLEKGHIFNDHIEIVCNWIVDIPAKTETIVIAEYPNGGKDIETIETEPEQGHWEKEDPSIPISCGDIPEDYPHDLIYVENIIIERYHPYTEEEIQQINELKLEAEKNQKTAEFIEGLPTVIVDTDTAVCELYEQTVSHANIISAQDDAICELYEMIGA